MLYSQYNMKLTFKLNENYLIYQSLIKGVNMQGWVDIQNEMWDKYRAGYELLQGKHNNVFIASNYFDNLKKSTNDLKNLIEELRQKDLYKILLKETYEYKDWLEKEWNTNKHKVLSEMKSILKIDLSKYEIKVLVVSSKMWAGSHLGNNVVAWGHSEDFKSYSLVYLMHEAMHVIIETNNNLTHAVIELATDNELRIRLNSEGKYYYVNNKLLGHTHLLETEKKIEKDWKKYLETNDQNIFEFIKRLEIKYPKLR